MRTQHIVYLIFLLQIQLHECHCISITNRSLGCAKAKRLRGIARPRLLLLCLDLFEFLLEDADEISETLNDNTDLCLVSCLLIILNLCSLSCALDILNSSLQCFYKGILYLQTCSCRFYEALKLLIVVAYILNLCVLLPQDILVRYGLFFYLLNLVLHSVNFGLQLSYLLTVLLV